MGSGWDLRVRPAAPAPAASGNLGTWKSGILEIWEFGDLGTWKSRTLESKQSQKLKFSKSKSVLPKMSASSGLIGKGHLGPHLGPSQAIFSMDRKNPKDAYVLAIFLGGALGPIHLVWANGL